MAHEQSTVVKEASMFILATFILAYQYYRTDAHDVGPPRLSSRNLAAVAQRARELPGLQMANDGVRTCGPYVA